GVSTVPGHIGEIEDAKEAAAIAREIGFPVMLKASAGGGGKGIRIVWSAEEMAAAFAAVAAEAKGAFGDDRIFVEKFITDPRHIEIQVLGDQHGHLVHIFERECSIQRRNQKVIEEAPSSLIDPATRQAMAGQALALAAAVGYDSAGTVEFVAGQDKSFYFLEMNTRLQVEHPVTELITGLDLVEEMIRIAAGEPLRFSQDDLSIKGWAIESRIYAEDPARGFLPSIGRLVRYAAPAEGKAGAALVRNDAGVREGDEISIHYDPMIAKLSCWAPRREGAIAAMGRALEEFHIEGPQTNLAFLSAVMDQPRFGSGRLSTSYIPEEFPEGFKGLAPAPWQEDAFLAAAIFMHALQRRRARSGEAAGRGDERGDWAVITGTRRRAARVAEVGEDLAIELFEEGRTLKLAKIAWRPGEPLFSAELDGRAFTLEARAAAEGFLLRSRAAAQKVLVLTPFLADLHQRLPVKAAADTSRQVLSPMPGLVVSVEVGEGEEVKAGQALLVVEAMKMQNIIRAEREGRIARLCAKAGETVAADDILAEFA
ncbi:MAG: biotin/lipoyl-containing protein, partial [Caulobacteraceae bacterium]